MKSWKGDKSFHDLSLKKRKIVKEQISSCYLSIAKSNFIPNWIKFKNTYFKQSILFKEGRGKYTKW